MKYYGNQMAAFEHSAAVDSFEVIFDDFLVSFCGYFDANLADVSFWCFRFAGTQLSWNSHNGAYDIKSHDGSSKLTSP